MKHYFLKMSLINTMYRLNFSVKKIELVLEFVSYALRCNSSTAAAYWVGMSKIKEIK